ncbi:MAG: class I SAM-dependent methyltransferase [Cyanobacteria bacterium J06623_5]
MLTSTPQTEYTYSSQELSHTYSYMLPQLLSLLPKSENKEINERLNILDIGSGNGSLCYLLSQQGYRVTGVEPSLSGIKIAKNNFSNCKFLQASVYELPEVLHDRFDIVIAADVIEHLFSPKELIKAARRCLKPDGTLIITTPYHGYLKNLFLALSGKLDAHFTTLWEGGHIKFFSVDSLSKLLKLEDFSDINYAFAGRVPFVWKTMLCSSKPTFDSFENPLNVAK